MKELSEKKKVELESIKRRLKRIEGQLKGIQRMIDQDACCMDILVQISAVRAATSKVGLLILENHMETCLHDVIKGENTSKEKTLEDLLNVMYNFIK